MLYWPPRRLPTRGIGELFQEALEAGRRRDYERSVELLARVVGTSDRFPQALLYLGRAYHALGEMEKAVRALYSYVRANPGSAAGHFFLGRSFLALGMYPEAIHRLRVAISRNPSFPQAYGLLGFAYLKAHLPEHAVVILKKGLELDPENKSLQTAYLNTALVAGIKLFHRGRLTDAADLFNEVLSHGEAIVPHVYLATIYRELGRAGDAISHLDVAAGMSPDDPVLHLQRALALMDLGRQQEALEEIRLGARLLKSPEAIGGTPEEILRSLSIRLFSEGRYKDALFYATKLLKAAYDDPRLHALVGETHRILGDYRKAKNHYLRALENDRDSLELRCGLLPILWALGEHEELARQAAHVLRRDQSEGVAQYFHALALSKIGGPAKEVIGALQSQVRVKGPDPILMSALGSAYLSVGLPDLAEGWFVRTLKVSSEDADALRALASIYEQRKDRKKQKGVYLQYLEAFPDDRKTRKALLRILLEIESFADAAEQIIRLLPAEPNSQKLKTMLALCYRRVGKYSDALIILKDLIRTKSESEELMKAVVYCLDKLGARNVAAQVIEGYFARYGEKLSLMQMLGVLHYQEDDLEKAAATFRRAISLAPRDWRSYRNLGMVYRKIGNKAFADTFLSRAEEYRRASQ